MTRFEPFFFSTIEQSMGYLHLAEIQKITKKNYLINQVFMGFFAKQPVNYI